MPGEVTGRTGDIHLFCIDGIDLAYDGASGALHRLSYTGRDVLAWVLARGVPDGDEMPPALVQDLSRHPADEIKESWDELRYLAGGTLFARDLALGQSGGVSANRDALEAGVKAMCLDVAHDCNLACSYCFASAGSFGGRPCLMTKDGGRAAIDFLMAASKDRKYLDVDFFGGEPLLAFAIVRDVVHYAREKGGTRGKEFRFTLTTNCTLLDEDKIAFLNDENVSLILSVDGRPHVHDATRRFRDGRPSHAIVVEKAASAVHSRAGRDYYLRGTYTRANLDFDADIRYLYAQGFRRLSLEPAVGDAGDALSIGEEDIPAIRDSYLRAVHFWSECAAKGDPFEFYHFNLGLTGGLCRERRITGCGAGYEYVAVTPTGDVYPCHQLVGKPEYLLGSTAAGITRPGVSETFHDARIPNKPACLACWARYLCGGGCHARAVSAGNPLTEPDPRSCRIMTTRLECALYAQIMSETRKEI